MNHLLRLIVICLALTLGGQSQPMVASAPRQAQQMEAHVSPVKHQQAEALLSDGQDIYRICNSRPQRVLPTHGSKSERAAGRPSYHYQPSKKFLGDGQTRTESAPFQSHASRLYYVIALRHIIR